MSFIYDDADHRAAEIARHQGDPGYCPLCRFSFVPEIPSNRREHQRRHDITLRGVRAAPLRSDQVLTEHGDLRITLVTPFSPMVQQERAGKVARRAKKDTPFDVASYSAGEREEDGRPRVVLGLRGGRAVAMVVFREVEQAAHVTWDRVTGQTTEPVASVSGRWWGVMMLWVLPAQRGAGLAEQLIVAGAQALAVGVDALAWSVPFTPAGARLARRLTGDTLWITG